MVYLIKIQQPLTIIVWPNLQSPFEETHPKDDLQQAWPHQLPRTCPHLVLLHARLVVVRDLVFENLLLGFEREEEYLFPVAGELFL